MSQQLANFLLTVHPIREMDTLNNICSRCNLRLIQAATICCSLGLEFMASIWESSNPCWPLNPRISLTLWFEQDQEALLLKKEMKFLYMQQIDSKKTQRGEKNCLKLTCNHGSKGDSYSNFHIHDENTNCEYHMFD